MKILVLRAGALGDLILTLPVLDAIRSQLPQAFIELWGIQPQAALVRSVNRVSRLDSAENASLFVPGSLSAGLRERLRHFDVAVNLLADEARIVSTNLSSVGIGLVANIAPRIQPGIHVVFHLASALEPLGLRLGDPVPKLQMEEYADRRSVLAFHPGSGSRKKNWPVQHWNDFAQSALSVFERLLLIGGEADGEVMEDLYKIWKGPPLQTLIGRNLRDVADALSSCAVFVGHDTGVTHLAAAVQTPTIALFGPTDPQMWRPLGNHVCVIRGTGEGMDGISAASVGESVRAFRREVAEDSPGGNGEAVRKFENVRSFSAEPNVKH